mmetsp:Transcript_5025/g.10152  ORF Transcript_5025/g.10152 Transcript_5025/m.10152 type:complete len:229 (-) Transcript_5025:1941-2627(-)
MDLKRLLNDRVDDQGEPLVNNNFEAQPETKSRSCVRKHEDISELTSPCPRSGQKKPKTYSHPVASRYCHVCSRDTSTRSRRLAHCSNLRLGTCQKAFCHICLDKLGVDFSTVSVANSTWACFHCEGRCPSGSRCESYNKAAEKRRIQGQLRRQATSCEIASSLAGGTDEIVLNCVHALQQLRNDITASVPRDTGCSTLCAKGRTSPTADPLIPTVVSPGVANDQVFAS